MQGSKRMGVGPEPRTAARAEDLMRAALELFAIKEFAKITLRDIQRASGFDAALLYYYFKDKQDLFDAAVKFALAEASGDRKVFASPGGDPVKAIRSWMRHCLKRSDSNRTIFRIMLHYVGSRRGASALERSVQKFYRREEIDILTCSIEQGIAKGVFRKVNAAAVARFVSVHLDGITAASMVRQNFDIADAFRDLEAALWLQLGYAPAKSRLRSLNGGARHHQSSRSNRVSIGR